MKYCRSVMVIKQKYRNNRLPLLFCPMQACRNGAYYGILWYMYRHYMYSTHALYVYMLYMYCSCTVHICAHDIDYNCINYVQMHTSGITTCTCVFTCCNVHQCMCTRINVCFLALALSLFQIVLLFLVTIVMLGCLVELTLTLAQQP